MFGSGGGRVVQSDSGVELNILVKYSLLCTDCIHSIYFMVNHWMLYVLLPAILYRSVYHKSGKYVFLKKYAKGIFA